MQDEKHAKVAGSVKDNVYFINVFFHIVDMMESIYTI